MLYGSEVAEAVTKLIREKILAEERTSRPPKGKDEPKNVSTPLLPNPQDVIR